MTKDEYDLTGWTGNMKAEYRGHIYDIGSAHFPEYLVGLDDGSDDYIWVRCENITLVPNVKYTELLLYKKVGVLYKMFCYTLTY